MPTEMRRFVVFVRYSRHDLGQSTDRSFPVGDSDCSRTAKELHEVMVSAGKNFFTKVWVEDTHTKEILLTWEASASCQVEHH